MFRVLRATASLVVRSPPILFHTTPAAVIKARYSTPSAPNPYATALDGLDLPDPVAAFFDFCREREAIRHRRENGDPAPWTNDEVLQRGRFLNVFREDDRGTKALLRFVEPIANPIVDTTVPAVHCSPGDLLQALFFARWCNRAATLDALADDGVDGPELKMADSVALREFLAAREQSTEQPWCNMTAYPVEPVRWEGREWSRLDAATELFGRKDVKLFLTHEVIAAQGSVDRASCRIGTELGMSNDFPVFMAVMDLAWFRPDLIDPASPVPTGIGAVAYLDLLQNALGLDDHFAVCAKMIELQADYWPEAKRALQPIDVEYLSCECRKYYSYVNGTKTFEGKNVFMPGVSPTNAFDITPPSPPPAAGAASVVAELQPAQADVYVIAGGPCSGKTTLMTAMANVGFAVEPETAERAINEGLAQGRTVEELRANAVEWQHGLLRQDFALFDGLFDGTTHGKGRPVLTDTSFIETLVFSEMAGIEMGPGVVDWLNTRRFKTVFFLAPIDAYEQTAVRMEDQELAVQISEWVQTAYRDWGYELVIVPSMPVADRVDFITAKIDSGFGGGAVPE